MFPRETFNCDNFATKCKKTEVVMVMVVGVMVVMLVVIVVVMF